MGERTRQFAREAIRKLDIQDGDVILMQYDTEEHRAMAMKKFDALRRALGAQGKERCIVIMVLDGEEIRVLPEEEMASYGWVRPADYYTPVSDEEE